MKSKTNVTHQEFFTLCEDVRNHPDEYRGVSVERRVERAVKILGKPVSDYSVKGAAKAVGVKLAAPKGNSQGPYKPIRDDIDQLKERVGALERQVANLLEMQAHHANGRFSTTVPR